MLRAENSSPVEEQKTEITVEKWPENILFVTAIHVLAAVALSRYRPSIATITFCLIQWQASSLGITMGYHRLWSHRSYEANWYLKLILCLLGTTAFQGSIRWWVLRHRLHHRFVDTDNDPHNALKGFWFSHIGWIFERRSYEKRHLIDLKDLDSDDIVVWQHRYFLPLAGFLAFGLPIILCSLWGDALGGFLYGGCVLRVIIWHSVFSINSLAHYFGTQEFSKTISARGNWFLALLTCGEGHHNFHHEFPQDYRNGVHWLDYDPTKWVINLAARLGWASKLRTTDKAVMVRAQRLAAEGSSSNELAFPKMTVSDFDKRCAAGARLIIIEGWVVDIAGYLEEHPGGAEILLEFVGCDATEAFNGGHNIHSQAARLFMKPFRIASIQTGK